MALMVSAPLTPPRGAVRSGSIGTGPGATGISRGHSRSRFRARLVGGEEVGVILAGGQILRGGDLLLASDGRVIEVVAAAETVSTVHSADPRALARAAYHLGNRHVALQIGEG